MFKSFFSFFSTQTLEKSHSKFNPDLKVQKHLGKTYLYVCDTQQSGPWEEKIWTTSIKDLNGYKKILILGLGPGNLAKKINLKFPKAEITGVEIDPKVIEIGKKYFDLNQVSNLKIIIADAFAFINKHQEKFDLIFVDLFVGQNSPKTIENETFLKNLSQTVSKNGIIVFNRLTTKTTNFELENFIDKLSKFFKIEKTRRIDFNSIIFCSRREKL